MGKQRRGNAPRRAAAASGGARAASGGARPVVTSDGSVWSHNEGRAPRRWIGHSLRIMGLIDLGCQSGRRCARARSASMSHGLPSKQERQTT